MSRIAAFFTTRDAADRIGVTDARVRQMCGQHKIGQKAGRDWLLTEKNVQQLEMLPRRYKKNS